MCLLVVLHRIHPDAPLVVAANRDELLSRPAIPMTVLREAGPRILGGRDEVGGGTWLAVNEHGVVAGLTNAPGGRRDPSRRSRGELPLALARGPDAAGAAAAFAASVRPADYNPSWLLVGDGRSLHYLDMNGGERPRLASLAPGLHVLENRPLEARSPKADRVREALVDVTSRRGEALRARLEEVLRDHSLPAGAGEGEGRVRPPEAEAACVHAGPYGTRSSTIVLVAPGGGPPRVWSAPGPPCTTPFAEVTGRWSRG